MNLKPNRDNTIILKSPREIEIMRESGRLVAEVGLALERQAEAGMTTLDLNEIAGGMFKEAGAVSTALGYYGYPGQICVSVNDEVVHGIPGKRKLKHGDLVKCDIAAKYRGYVGDTTVAFAIGGLDVLPREVRNLVKITYDALMAGVAAARPGNRLGDIGAAIEAHARQFDLFVVRDFVGHGVGREMHEAPQVYHYDNGHKGPVLRPGMCLAIEPQINLGSPEVYMLEDKWTAKTADGSLSCHWEHTVAITPDGPDILTLREAVVGAAAD